MRRTQYRGRTSQATRHLPTVSPEARGICEEAPQKMPHGAEKKKPGRKVEVSVKLT